MKYISCNKTLYPVVPHIIARGDNILCFSNLYGFIRDNYYEMVDIYKERWVKYHNKIIDHGFTIAIINDKIDIIKKLLDINEKDQLLEIISCTVYGRDIIYDIIYYMKRRKDIIYILDKFLKYIDIKQYALLNISKYYNYNKVSDYLISKGAVYDDTYEIDHNW